MNAEDVTDTAQTGRRRRRGFRVLFGEKLELVHASVPGRARFKAIQLYRAEHLSEWVASRLSNKQGIERASINPRTATILVQYKPKAKDLEQISRTVKGVLRQGLRLGRDELSQAMQKNMRQKQRPSPASHLGARWDRMKVRDVALALRSSVEAGIAPRDARKRLRRYGKNRLNHAMDISDWSILKKQFASPPALLLIGSAALSLATGGLADAIVILSVVGINGYIGFITESSAEKRIRSLGRNHPPKAWVIRGGRRIQVHSSELVPGDLLFLSPGAWIPADGRLVEANSLQVDESTLTGESLPVLKTESPLHEKRRALSDLMNLVFRGTVVTGGSGLALIVGTGGDTEIGRIESLMSKSDQPETPLQAQLRNLSNQMVWFSVGASAAVFGISWLRGRGLFETLKTSVSLAIAAIPESLPTIATTTLAQGIRTLEHGGILVRHLDAIETLGRVTTLCLDKTGTLTLNQMSVTIIQMATRKFSAVSGKELAKRHPELKTLAEVVSLCNEAVLSGKGSSKKAQGSATERALLQFAQKAGVDPDRLRSFYRLETTRYRAEGRSYMSTVHLLHGNGHLVAVKGRPLEVLKLCDRYQDGTKVMPLNFEKRKKISAQDQQLAKEGLRVLGVAYRKADSPRDTKDEKLIWLGLVGMEDPLRPGVRHWIEQAKGAGIRTLMITGDQTATAKTIGRAVGLSGNGRTVVIDSSELDFANPDKLHEQVRKAHVFSRVGPADKLKIIEALQSTGEVVAMIGDGVNDGPALKIADVGIALTSPGVEVTSLAADMILLRNELEKLSLALKEGRRIQDDIRKSVGYIMTHNSAEVLVTLISVVSGFGEPLTPLQLLWTNMVTDIFPELALAQEPAEADVMCRPPTRPASGGARAEQRFLSSDDMRRVRYDAMVLTLSSLAPYLLARRKYGDTPESRTAAFLTLVSSSLLYTVSARSEAPVLLGKRKLLANPYVPLAIGAGFAAESIAILFPAMRAILGTERLRAVDLFECGLGSMVPLLLTEVAKAARSRSQQAA